MLGWWWLPCAEIKDNGTVFFLKRPNFWGDGTYRRRVRYPSNTLEYFRQLHNATNVLVLTNGGILSQIYKDRGPTFHALHAMGLRMPYAFGCIVRYLLKSVLLPLPESFKPFCC